MNNNRYFLSAYGLAVKHGFTGTEDDFLRSLVGPQGPAGPQGPQGLPGPQGVGKSVYYQTEREKIKPTHNEIDTEYIYGLYDDLVKNYPNIKKTDNPLDSVKYTQKDGTEKTLEIREYVISTGDYSTEGDLADRYGVDYQTKKPVYLLQSGIHGQERKGVFSTYRFVRDLVTGHNIPNAFKDGAILKVIPIVNPIGFDLFNGTNAGYKLNEKGEYVLDTTGVNINRNFDHNWDAVDKLGHRVGSGNKPNSETETNAIIKWLNENKENAELFIDIHNSGSVNEIAVVLGASGNDAVYMAKKIALRGLDKVIPFWRDVIKYPATFNVKQYLTDKNGDMYWSEEQNDWAYELRDEAPIFSSSVDANQTVLGCSAMSYASEVVGIPAIAIELSTYYGNYEDWQANPHAYPPETIAAGAEAIGNILIEFYEQAFFGEVNEDMKQIDRKLDTLSEGMSADMEDIGSKIDTLNQYQSFRVERGAFTPSESTGTLTINVPANAKTVEIRKVGEATNVTAFPAFAYFITYTSSPAKGQRSDACKNVHAEYLVQGRASGASVHADTVDGGIYIDLANDGCLHFEPNATYEWIAYCWDDVPTWTGGSY